MSDPARPRAEALPDKLRAKAKAHSDGYISSDCEQFSCELCSALLGGAMAIEALLAENERLTEGWAGARNEANQWAAEQLGWRQRAEAAEQREKALREALEPFMRRWMDNPKASTYLYSLVLEYEPELPGSNRRREMLQAAERLASLSSPAARATTKEQ